MKIRMLPNWCKKVGFLFFLVGLVVSSTTLSARNSFFEGYCAGSGTESKVTLLKPIFIEKWYGELGIHIFEIILIVGLLIYMFSKEKIEDDYINLLRLKSYQLTFLIGLISTLLIYVFFGNLKFGIELFITLFLLVYLIVFALKKIQY